MTYELKSSIKTGQILQNQNGTFTQNVNIVIGVINCPYLDIKTEKTIQYIFPGTQSMSDIEIGITAFATQWVKDNYIDTI